MFEDLFEDMFEWITGTKKWAKRELDLTIKFDKKLLIELREDLEKVRDALSYEFVEGLKRGEYDQEKDQQTSTLSIAIGSVDFLIKSMEKSIKVIESL